MPNEQTRGTGADLLQTAGVTLLFLVGSGIQLVLGGHGGATAGILVVRFVVELVTGGADAGGQGVAALSACTFFALVASLTILIFPDEFRLVPATLFAISAFLAWAIPLFLFSEYWPVSAIAGTPILASAGIAMWRVISNIRGNASKPSL